MCFGVFVNELVLQGNNIALTYRHSQAMTSDTRMAISVPFTEVGLTYT